MKKPIHIEIPSRYRGDTQKLDQCPPIATHKLAYASCNYWRHARFSIIEQYYDAKDVFIGLTEVRNKDEITIPFSCERYDLYWLYQLKGRMELLDRTGINKILRISNGQYILTAMPEEKYYAYFKPGRHLLCYFVVKSEWLLRNDGAGLDIIDSFLAQLRQSERITASVFAQELLTIGPVVRKQLFTMFTLSKGIPIHVDAKLYKLSINLLVQSLQDLTDDTIVEDRHKLLIDQVRLYVSEQLKEGQIPPIEDIAAHFNISTSYLRKQHKRYYAIDLRQFIKQVRFDFAYYLVTRSNLSNNIIASMCGFADKASFGKAFKRYFGFPPSQASSQFERTQNFSIKNEK
ncbi:helix-turn-helix transcriptional regulator [Olivibacter sp. SDN3]|uniref:helix-turn-helix domain-containing protein n=1 Tax=Olivibacter sp. SDN3 TaxID=2764720 RepID=UPI00165140BE|nr:helix-turn-helix transcriptional regulator [Olivibacter sp. SDN3]QNL47905.1 helix-turn-helix transcriptional regulator [Olivibacter sp. SDN3]